MKRILNLLVAVILLTSLVSVNSCQVGENDPFLSFRTRDNRLSAVWTLEAGTSINSFSFNEEFKWLSNDCEDVVGIENYVETDTESKTYIYTNSMVNYDRKYTTTRIFFDPYEGSEFEDAQNIQRSVNYSYEISIKTNGEYRVYVIFNLFEENFPLSPDAEGDMQFGKTFSGTYEYTDTWHWQENSLGSKSAVEFAGFPLIQFDIEAIYKLPDLSFDYNYINAITFKNESMIFEIDKLNDKELTLTTSYNDRGFYQEVDRNWEAYDTQGNDYNCEGTYTFTTVEDHNHRYEFIGDGKNVDQ